MPEIKNTFRVGIYKVEMTYSTREKGMRAEWEPDMPRRKLSAQELEQYRAGRDALFLEVSKLIGGAVMVVET